MTGMKVLWPERLALVCKKNDLGVLQKDIKDYGGDEVAYQMGFSREEIVWGKVAIAPKEPPKDVIALQHEYTCSKYGAYYLSRVVVRPLEGKMLPQGGLCLQADGQAVTHGPLSRFLPDPEPIDCTKTYAWEKIKLFKACVLAPEGALGEQQLGFMLPNLSKVQVHLSDVVAEETVSLEIGIVTAYYSTKASEFAKPQV